MSYHHAGVIVEDGAQDRFEGSVLGANLGPMHEVADPEVIDIIHLVGFSHIGAGLAG